MTASIIILAIVFLLAYRYPPFMVFVLGMTNIAGDGFGLNSFLRAIGLDFLAIGLNLPIFVASAIACYRILTDARKRNNERARILVLTLLGVSAWIAIAILAKGGAVSFAIGSVVSNGILVAPIVMAYWKDYLARAIFVALLLAQLSLASAVVLMPGSPIGVISGTHYTSGLGDLSHVSQSFNGQVSRTTDQPRMFAQFIDPDTYGLYATIGLIIGGYMCLNGRRWSHRVIGGTLIAFAAFGSITTVSRGATTGLLAGLLIIIASETLNHRFPPKLFVGLILALLAGGALVVYKLDTVASMIESLSRISPNDTDLSARTDALRLGFQGIADFPVFGVPLDFVWPRNIAPHELMFYFGAVYGVPAGILVTFLLWTVVAIDGRYSGAGLPASERWERYLSVAIGWTIMGTSITNNLSAPILFWVGWGIASIPWFLPSTQMVARYSHYRQFGMSVRMSRG